MPIHPESRNLFATARISPGQIAFLAFALFFLLIPAERYVFNSWAWAKDLGLGLQLARITFLLILGGVLFLIPDLRRTCRTLLSTPIPKDKRAEIALVTMLSLIAASGVVAGIVLWIWSTGGEPALARWLDQHMNLGMAKREDFSAKNIVSGLVIGVLLAPIMEELIFRGMLYPAWASRWGWFPAAIVTSAFFAAFHPYMVSQFVSSLILIALLRRTGSLRSCIAAHAVFNFVLWIPFLRPLLQPGQGRETGELSFWTPQLVCLVFAFFAVPLYLWLAGQSNRLEASAIPDRGLQRS
jgi:membrane protease YdiL (CAAX protease family)